MANPIFENRTSLMMVTYNRLDLTKETLNILFNNTVSDFNFIIIDNASSDGTADYLNSFLTEELNKNKYMKSFVIQKNEKNLGIGIARNQALKLSNPTDKWLSTIDNDVNLPFNWLGQCIEALEKNTNYGMIGVNLEGVEYPVIIKNGCEMQHKAQGNLGTACTVFPRTLHKMIGYFNAEYGLYGMEDSDFGFRARVVGYQLGYIKQSGKHLGEGENDVGEYREFKTASHQANLAKFHANCQAYYNRTKPLFIPFKQ